MATTPNYLFWSADSELSGSFWEGSKAGSTIYADLAEPYALNSGIIMPPKIQLLQH
jgi:hypothetical protein